MQLQLKRPLVFFDLETTGVNITKDRIVEISILKVFPNGKEEITSLRINPEIPIPPEVTLIHGISDKDVANAPTFSQVAEKLASVFKNSDLAGFNSNNFDIPLLAESFARSGVDIDLHKAKKIDVQTIFHKMEPRTLSAAHLFYCGKTLENAHSAEADTKATYEVLKAQIVKYGDSLKNDVDFLAKFSTQNNRLDFAGRFVYNEQGGVVFNFGKYKGRLVTDVLRTDPGYYSWMKEGDFAQDTLNVLDQIKINLSLGKE